METNAERLIRMERRVEALHRKVDSLLRAANLDIILEIEQMADFTDLIAKVEKMRGRVESTNAFVAGLKKQIEDLAADMSDEEDQAKILALAADVGALTDKLPQAIDANPGPGGSMGGINV